MQKRLFQFVDLLSSNFKKYFVITNDFLCLFFIYYFCSMPFDFFNYEEVFLFASIYSLINITSSLFLKNYQIVWGFFGVRDVFSIGTSILISVILSAIYTGLNNDIYFYILLAFLSFYSVIFLE